MISVVQPGARLNYAVPTIFAQAGRLKTLYTDMHADHPGFRLLDRVTPPSLRPRGLRRLLGRHLPADLPADRVKDRPMQFLLRKAAAGFGIGSAECRNGAAGLLADVSAADFGPGDVLYTVLVNEDVEVIRDLKQRGVKIVHECIIGPDVGLLLAGEYDRFGVTAGRPSTAEVEEGRRRDREKYGLVDLVLTPSTFTLEAVAELAPEGTPIAIVPYGIDQSTFSSATEPVAGRVLSVGSVGFRKGHPDLAATARRLRDHAQGYEVRVVGPFDAGFEGDDGLFEGPTYVGQMPRTEIVKEYAKADIFAFPTICDSFGIVLVEAMAMGVPVVCSTNCGDVVRDGVDGFVVPPRDPEALADRIRMIVEDRSLRDEMSKNAKERAREFTLEAYGARLLAAVDQL